MGLRNLCVIAVLLGSACSAAPAEDGQTSSRIVGGGIAEPGVHKWMVSLRSNNAAGVFSHRCGGSIITDTWVLTAAHCLPALVPNGVPVESFRAWVGSSLLSEGGVGYEGVTSVAHPDYNSQTIKNDIGLINTVPIAFDDLVQPIGINFEFVGGAVDVTVTGWGTTYYGGSASNELKYVNLPTLTPRECITRRNAAVLELPDWSQSPFIDGDAEICTFHSVGQGTCHGDSGSALYEDSTGLQVGIVSWGFPCAVGGPDMFARVSTYGEWIRSYVSGV